jgi:catabolite regulation protein CreA
MISQNRSLPRPFHDPTVDGIGCRVQSVEAGRILRQGGRQHQSCWRAGQADQSFFEAGTTR